MSTLSDTQFARMLDSAIAEQELREAESRKLSEEAQAKSRIDAEVLDHLREVRSNIVGSSADALAKNFTERKTIHTELSELPFVEYIKD